MLPIPTHQAPLDESDVLVEQKPEPEAPVPVSDTFFIEYLLQLFPDYEPVRTPSPQLSVSDYNQSQSLVGTSTPLLTNSSLTDFLSNYPIWPDKSKLPHLMQ